ncbi:hypothetical protein [Desulforamulus aquiferis]|uniref:CobQ/CobB/MinD/ParA nucleotide binding domain-containing protein n=1 Tax=Desulforamulus aquiferis TaxID=1397668 RepID=A0AAW7Z9P0_9FIRM|nr:hypothetical protein [Desulforamulus aquiferis]MDO7785796.1 hypothetical protein [Desulforamulus aquiferis]
MNVLLATEDEIYLEPLSAIRQFRITPVTSREHVVAAARYIESEVVILSPGLPGEVDIIDIVEDLIDLNIRVVFLAGELNPANLTVRKLVELSVYDILFEPITIGRLKDALINPAKEFTPNSSQTFNGLNELEQEKEGTLERLKTLGTEVKISLPQISQIKKKADSKNLLQNVIAVYSPTPSGKTMLALNLATTLSQLGNNVALVDGDISQLSLGNWVEIPEGEDGIYRLLKDPGNSLEYGYSPRLMPGLFLFTASVVDPEAANNKKSMLNALKGLNSICDVVVVDLSSDIKNPVTSEVINIASQVILVADTDFNHLRRFQIVMDKLSDDLFSKCCLVVNRAVESARVFVSDAEKAVGLKSDALIPDAALEVLESIKSGIPVVLFHTQMKQSLDDLADRLLVKIQSSAELEVYA